MFSQQLTLSKAIARRLILHRPQTARLGQQCRLTEHVCSKATALRQQAIVRQLQATAARHLTARVRQATAAKLPLARLAQSRRLMAHVCSQALALAQHQAMVQAQASLQAQAIQGTCMEGGSVSSYAGGTATIYSGDAATSTQSYGGYTSDGSYTANSYLPIRK